MASLEEHCYDCVQELGEPFTQVHLWLDELFPSLGAQHRAVRHNDEGVEYVRQRWGTRAAAAARIHIAKDEGRPHKLVGRIWIPEEGSNGTTNA